MISEYLIGIVLLIAGSFFQEFAYFRKSVISLSSTRDCSTSRATLLLIFTIGLSLEITSLALIPLSTYILFGCAHLICFKLNLISDENRNHSSAEYTGTALMTLGLIVEYMFGARQEEIVDIDEFNNIINGSYFLWMCGSLTLNLTMRRLGFYQGKVLLETSIPAQIAAFGYGGLKICMYSIEMYISGYEFSIYLFIFSVFVITISLSSVSIFLWYYSKQYDLVVVLGGYYLWLICYALPLGVLVVSGGVHYDFKTLCSLTVSTSLVTLGGILHTYYRMEYLQNFKMNKDVVPPPKPSGALKKEQSEDTENIELTIEDENLMDSEIVDEDSLINNIKNI
ncbi:unnamed protein product [Blepharisma stoltei]|uniref:Uncharacterized protein n=1 Tax=Blepharisma stoltei TaxID=1481888 RepID=A0AAU9INK4_9CILI|nr:unnamed protein product [Blepharisma stoltei]